MVGRLLEGNIYGRETGDGRFGITGMSANTAETHKQCLLVNSVISVSSVAKKRHSAIACKS